MRIHLRKRASKLSGNNSTKGKKKMYSLYLAYHTTRQKTRYEWLKLYLHENPKTNLEKEHNKETLALAEAIRAKRLIDFQTTGSGFVSNEKGKIGFLEYFHHLAQRKASGSNGNGGNWKSTYEHLKEYCDGIDYALENIDDLFLEGFKEYLMKKPTPQSRIAHKTPLLCFPGPHTVPIGSLSPAHSASHSSGATPSVFFHV